MQTYTFKPNDDGLSMAVMSYEGDEAHVVIPEQYCAKPISVLYDKLFAGHKEIVDIRFPDTVTDIGEFVFDGCRNLRQISLPAGLEHIWPYGFARCGIEEITIPANITSIEKEAFFLCSDLKKITSLNPTPPSLGQDVFSYVSPACVVYVPKGSRDAYIQAWPFEYGSVLEIK